MIVSIKCPKWNDVLNGKVTSILNGMIVSIKCPKWNDSVHQMS